MRQSGEVVRPFSYAARFLIRGTSSGAPNWHQPTQSSPSKTSAAWAWPSRIRCSFAARLCAASVRESSGWNPMHQHPPKMPLLRSTSAANAAHVDWSRAFTVYVGSGIKPSLNGATAPAFRPELAAPLVSGCCPSQISAAGRACWRLAGGVAVLPCSRYAGLTARVAAVQLGSCRPGVPFRNPA